MELRRRALLAGTLGAALSSLGGARARVALALERLDPVFARLPRAGLWDAEPPIHEAVALARALDLRGGVHVVRDDEAGTVFGGGKARKLDLILGEALGQGAREIATTGGTGSNHARATATAARALGLRCHLALLPERETPEVRRNLEELRRSGATLEIGGPATVDRARAAAERRGATWIPMGGTCPLGNLAFVDAALSLTARATARSGRAALPIPDVVVTALGSTGSAVGLAVGFALADAPTRVVGVRCSSPGTSSRAAIDRGIDETVALLRGLAPSLDAALAARAKARLAVEAGELGGGYGVTTARSRAAQTLVEAEETLRIDATYGAKAAAALASRAREWRDARLVLWLGSDARWLAGRAAR